MEELNLADGFPVNLAGLAELAAQFPAPADPALERIEAKLDKVLTFDRLLVELLAPMIPKKIAMVVVPQLRKVLE